MGYKGASLSAICDDRLTRKAAREIARDVGAAMTDATKRHASVRSGAHRESIERSRVERIPGGWRAGAHTTHPLAAVFEYGARAHEIGPKTAKALGTPTGAFAHVEHPGRAGDHAFLKGVADTDARLTQIAEPALARMRAEFERNANRRR